MYCQFKIKEYLLANKVKINEIIRFGIVGVLATGIHYGIYLLLNLVLNTNIAYSIGYFIGLIVNFFLSNYFTFKTKPTISKGFGFGLGHLINYILHLVLLNFMLFIGISDIFAPIPVFLIAVPINFIIIRFVLKSNSI